MLLTATARAERPSLDSVGYSPVGQAIARFTVLDEAEPDQVEVATAPDLEPDGSFVEANVVDLDVFIDPFADYWRSELRLRPGTYYVHVSATTLCDGEEGCVDVTEWSNVLPLVVPLPKPGRYSGRTFFGERISFAVSRNSKTIRNLTAEYDIVCSRGSGIIKVKFAPIPLRNLTFDRSVRVRGGGRMTFRVRGTVRLNGRANGRLDAKGSIRGAGKCHDFGDPDWSARRK